MINRRAVLAAPLALAAPAVHAQGRADVLRYVPTSNLAYLDPSFGTAKVTANHGYAVFDTLYAVDAQYRPQPQMAQGHEVSDNGRLWRIRLRDGLRFHDGTPVLATDCVASLRRWATRDGFGQLLAAEIAEWRTPSDRVIEIALKRPFPALLDAIAKPVSYVPFIFPARLADGDIGKPITEMIGSGPFRFVADEFVSGSRVVYQHFDRYQPRAEPPDWASGGKIARFARVEWVVIPDPSIAIAALRTGDVDWIEQPLADLVPDLRKRPDITVTDGDATGYLAIMRLNHLVPPFDDVRVRRAVQAAVDQSEYMQALVGDAPGAWRRCASLFACGGPSESDAGATSLLDVPDMANAKRLLAASSYAGQKVVIINPADVATIKPLGEVTADLLRRLGMQVDLIEADFGSLARRLASQEPADHGGWNIFHTWWPGSSIVTPPGNALVRGTGRAGWVGWYSSSEVEALVQDWLAADDPGDHHRIAAEIQRVASTDVATIPLGQFAVPTAYRKSLAGVLPGPATFLWNVHRI